MNRTYYKYVSIEVLNIIFENSTLRITNPVHFNDPFDSGMPSYNGVINKNENFKSLCDDVLSDILEHIPKEHYSTSRESNAADRYYIKNELSERQIKNNFKKLIRKYEKKLNESIRSEMDSFRSAWEKTIKEYRILSLTVEPDNILMWSHYADCHKGAIISFDNYFNKRIKDVTKVIYTNSEQYLNEITGFFFEYFKLSMKGGYENFMVAGSDGFSKVTFDSLAEEKMISIFKKMLYIKDNIWGYEKEYRLILKSNNDDIFNNGKGIDFIKVDLRLIKGIYFGVNSSDKDIFDLITVLRSKNIKTSVFKAQKNGNKIIFYKIHQNSIEYSGLQKKST
ncbi:DUF2971 domain-containing protein [Pectobacterium brasiliense]|uniref:DUF2971 domain-containing protein n=1 Tax=Pectobacterium brasiliense TaxID=180957 RepID=UPI0032EF246C